MLVVVVEVRKTRPRRLRLRRPWTTDDDLLLLKRVEVVAAPEQRSVVQLELGRAVVDEGIGIVWYGYDLRQFVRRIDD